MAKKKNATIKPTTLTLNPSYGKPDKDVIEKKKPIKSGVVNATVNAPRFTLRDGKEKRREERLREYGIWNL